MLNGVNKLRDLEHSINEFIAFFVTFSTFLIIHQINVTSTHFSSLLNISEENVSIYLTKLHSNRSLFITLGSVLQTIISTFHGDISIISTTSISCMLVCRLLLLLSLYFSTQLALHTYIILNAEAFFFGFFQITIFTTMVQHVVITRLSIHISGLITSVVQFTLDQLFYKKIFLIQIHYWFSFFTTTVSVGLWTFHIFFLKLLIQSYYDTIAKEVTQMACQFNLFISFVKTSLTNGKGAKLEEIIGNINKTTEKMKQTGNNKDELINELKTSMGELLEEIRQYKNLDQLINILNPIKSMIPLIQMLNKTNEQTTHQIDTQTSESLVIDNTFKSIGQNITKFEQSNEELLNIYQLQSKIGQIRSIKITDSDLLSKVEQVNQSKRELTLLENGAKVQDGNLDLKIKELEQVAKQFNGYKSRETEVLSDISSSYDKILVTKARLNLESNLSQELQQYIKERRERSGQLTQIDNNIFLIKITVEHKIKPILNEIKTSTKFNSYEISAKLIIYCNDLETTISELLPLLKAGDKINQIKELIQCIEKYKSYVEIYEKVNKIENEMNLFKQMLEDPEIKLKLLIQKGHILRTSVVETKINIGRTTGTRVRRSDDQEGGENKTNLDKNIEEFENVVDELLNSCLKIRKINQFDSIIDGLKGQFDILKNYNNSKEKEKLNLLENINFINSEMGLELNDHELEVDKKRDEEINRLENNIDKLLDKITKDIMNDNKTNIKDKLEPLSGKISTLSESQNKLLQSNQNIKTLSNMNRLLNQLTTLYDEGTRNKRHVITDLNGLDGILPGVITSINDNPLKDRIQNQLNELSTNANKFKDSENKLQTISKLSPILDLVKIYNSEIVKLLPRINELKSKNVSELMQDMNNLREIFRDFEQICKLSEKTKPIIESIKKLKGNLSDTIEDSKITQLLQNFDKLEQFDKKIQKLDPLKDNVIDVPKMIADLIEINYVINNLTGLAETINGSQPTSGEGSRQRRSTQDATNKDEIQPLITDLKSYTSQFVRSKMEIKKLNGKIISHYSKIVELLKEKYIKRNAAECDSCTDDILILVDELLKIDKKEITIEFIQSIEYEINIMVVKVRELGSISNYLSRELEKVFHSIKKLIDVYQRIKIQSPNINLTLLEIRKLKKNRHVEQKVTTLEQKLSDKRENIIKFENKCYVLRELHMNLFQLMFNLDHLTFYFPSNILRTDFRDYPLTELRYKMEVLRDYKNNTITPKIPEMMQSLIDIINELEQLNMSIKVFEDILDTSLKSKSVGKEAKDKLENSLKEKLILVSEITTDFELTDEVSEEGMTELEREITRLLTIITEQEEKTKQEIEELVKKNLEKTKEIISEMEREKEKKKQEVEEKIDKVDETINEVDNKNIELFSHWTKVLSPFLLIIPSTMIKDFTFPGIIPYSLLDLNECNVINSLIIPFHLVGPGIIYFTKKYINGFVNWTWQYHFVWSGILPQVIVLIISMMAIHTQIIWFNTIMSSISRTYLMSVVLISFCSLIQTASYVGVSNYVYYISNDVKGSIHLIEHHNILGMLLSFISYKLSFGYNTTRVKLRYNLRDFKGKSKNGFFYWIERTIMYTLTDILNDFRLKIEDYV